MNVVKTISAATVAAVTVLASTGAWAALISTAQVDGDLRTGGAGTVSPGTVYFGAAPGINDSFGTVGGTPNGATSVGSGGVGFTNSGLMLLSANATDIGAGSTFRFVYSMPLNTPLSGPVSINARLQFSLTPSTTSAQVLAPVSSVFLTASVDGCTALVTGGSAATFPANSGSPVNSYTPTFSATQLFTPTANCNSTLTTVVTFTGSGDLAQYGFTASVSVPEPVSAALLGTAVMGLAAVRRRRPATAV